MVRVRRSIWATAVVCGLLAASYTVLFDYRLPKAEKRTELQKLGVEATTLDIQDTERDQGRVKEEGRKPLPLGSARAPRSAYPPAKAWIELSHEPRLGETAEVTFIVIPLEDVPQMKVMWGKPLKGVEIVGGEKITYCSMKKEEMRPFSVQVKFVSSPVHFGVSAGRWWYATKLDQRAFGLKEGDERFSFFAGASIRRMIIDEETGQFGTWEQFVQHPCWNFDPLLGRKCRVSQGDAERNKKWIEEIRELEPSITDWEALYLYRDAMLYFPHDREESLRVYQRRGWEITLEKGKMLLEKRWLEEFKKKDRTYPTDLPENVEKHLKWLRRLEKESKTKDQDNGGGRSQGISPIPTAVDTPTQFTGRWLYQKYPYDTTGLDSVPFDAPVKKGMVAIWGYPHNSPSNREIRGRCHTEDDGTFDVTVDLEWGTLWTVWEVIYPIGPNSMYGDTAHITVSDPTPSPGGWKVPEDSSIWFWKADSQFSGITPGLSPRDFGTAYVDTTPLHQPRAGWMNIYQALLRAHDYVVPYTNPDTLGTVRALWEPAYDTTTGYQRDTIWVSGDTLPPLANTDEWDDLKLIHEYGHHVMRHCAQVPPHRNPDHWWYLSDSVQWGTAYCEGWSHLVASVVTDSVWYVDTQKGIGGDEAYFHSIEDPWQFSLFPWDSFHGGAWCEGAVAGVLWDIYDSADEDTYPVYPAPGWPDTNLADTLSLGFDEIWNIFDHHDPPGEPQPEACWAIYHFLHGWRFHYNYGHDAGLRPIVTHHRMDWDFGLGPPLGLDVRFDSDLWAAHLAWSPPGSKQPPIAGYCVYRKEFGDTLFDRVAEPSDTSYADTSVVTGLTYFYTVTAFDTLGIESDTSNNEWIWIPFSSDTVVATAFNNADKIAVDSNNIHLIFVSEGKICYSLSDNQAMSWSFPDTLGEGETPGLSLDTQGNPHVVWIGPDKGGYRYIYYARYDGTWHVDILLSPGGMPDLPLVRPYLPSLAVDPSGYGHVVWEERWITVPVDWRLKYARFETEDLDSIVVEQIDQTTVDDWYGSPSIALDPFDRPHVTYRRGSKGEIYYTMKDTAWTAPDSISESPSITSSWPCLDFCDSTLSAVWMEGDTSPAPDIFYRSRELGTSWDTIEHVLPTLDFSAFPVIVAGTYVARAESSTAGPDYDWSIHGARRKSDGTWEQLGDFPNIQGVHSRHPQAAFAQNADTGHLYVAWTEGDSAPFATMVRRFEVPTVSGFEKGVRAGVEEREFLFIPRVFALSQNYPNPCGEFTTINYQLPKLSHTSLKIYDVAGRLVRTLVDEKRKAGYYSVRWDGKGTAREKVASGIYFYRLSASPKRPVLPALSPAEGNEVEGSRGAGYFKASKKMVVLR